MQGTKILHSLVWTMKTGLKALGKISVTQMKSHVCDQLHFMSCCITTATGHVLPYMYLPQTDSILLNIITLEKIWTLLSGLICLFSQLWGCHLVFPDTRRRTNSYIPLAHQSPVSPQQTMTSIRRQTEISSLSHLLLIEPKLLYQRKQSPAWPAWSSTSYVDATWWH